jgi:hypothetical protein
MAGTVFAILSYATPSLDGGSLSFKHRTNELWAGDTILLVTQQGFPWGRSTLPSGDETANGQEGSNLGFADPSRLSSLAIFYAQLATSDRVRADMLKDGPIRGRVEAAPIAAGPDGAYGTQPLISITGTSTSAGGATALSWRAATALRTYLKNQQNDAKIPNDQRIFLEVVQKPVKARLLRPRKLTLPIMIFGTFLFAACGLALILENLRPQPAQLIGVETTQRSASDSRRRSA